MVTYGVCAVCLAVSVLGAAAGAAAGATVPAAGFANTANGKLAAGFGGAGGITNAARTDSIRPDTDGPIVPGPTAAPWSAVVLMEDNVGNEYQCSGSIISADVILTAGHCTYDDSESAPFAAADYLVAVGTADANVASPTQEIRSVSSVRVMSGYSYGGASSATDPYDIAELILTSPLVLNSAVQAIPIVGQGGEPAVGTGVSFYGWGESATGISDSFEHSLASTLIQPWVCASGQPSSLCSLSSSDDACPGDSGSGLVVTGAAPPVLIGVADYTYQSGSDANCGSNDPTGYADLASPEFAQWLAGSASPTLGPVTSSHAAIVDSQPQVGSTATCTSPSWSGSPTVSFLFVDAANNILQSGPAIYAVPQSALGQVISCVAVATNPGGTAYTVSSTSTATIAAQTVPDLSLSVSVHGAAKASSDAVGPTSALMLTATLKRSGEVRFTRTYSGESLSAALDRLAPGLYSVCVSSGDQGVYAAASKCLNWVHNGSAISYLRVSAGRLHGHAAIVVRALAPIRGDRASVTWIGRSGDRRVQVRKHIRLASKTTVSAPAGTQVRWLHVTVAASRIGLDGATLASGSRSVKLS